MKRYPSKIILFGEYTIIKGSSALAMPYSSYCSFWLNADETNDLEHISIDAVQSNNSLKDIFNDLKKLKKPKLALQKLKNDLDAGLWMCSNIPLGYGLGSSGAVSAGIYERYAIRKSENLKTLKQDLARIEHSFHGKSSGIDPLIAYTEEALWVHPDKTIQTVVLPTKMEGGTFFIVDSKKGRNSAHLIQFFMEKCKKTTFEADFLQPMAEAVDASIQFTIQNNSDELIELMAFISALQFMYLPPMIPQSLHELWMQGIESNDFYLKLCGAGGGGFALGFTNNWPSTKEYLANYDYAILI